MKTILREMRTMMMVYIAKGENEGRVQKANYKAKSKDCLKGCA